MTILGLKQHKASGKRCLSALAVLLCLALSVANAAHRHVESTTELSPHCGLCHAPADDAAVPAGPDHSLSAQDGATLSQDRSQQRVALRAERPTARAPPLRID